MNKRTRSQTNVTSCELFSCIQRYSYIYISFYSSEVWLKIIPDLLCSLGCWPENHCPWVPNVLVDFTCFAGKNATILILCDNKTSLLHMSKRNPRSAGSLHTVNRQWCKAGSDINYNLWILSLETGKGPFPFYLLIYFCCMLDHKEPLLNPLSFLARFEVPHCSWMFVSRLSCEFTRKLWFTEPLSGTVRLPSAASQSIEPMQRNGTAPGNTSEVPRSSTGLEGAWPGAVEQVGVSLLGDELIYCGTSVTCDSRAPTFLAGAENCLIPKVRPCL